MLVSEPSESGGNVRGAGATPVETGGRLKTPGMRKGSMRQSMERHSARIKVLHLTDEMKTDGRSRVNPAKRALSFKK